MQAANPGFQTGGYGMPAQYPINDPRIPNDPRQPLQMPANQQFQQFGPPSIAANQDEWLKSQFDLAGEHLGGIGDPEAAAAVAAQAGGPIGGGQGGASDGPGGGGFNPSDPMGFNDFGPETGISEATATALSAVLGPLATPAINSMTMTEKEEQEAFDRWSAFDQEDDPIVAAFNDLAELGFTEESMLADNPEGLAGVGLGGVNDNSGFGGAGGEAVSEGSQGAMGNEGPGNDGTGGQSSGGDDNDGGGRGGDGGSGGGGSSSGGPGSGTGGPR